jgi:hypothetical protein
MGKFVLKGSRLFAGGVDLTAVNNKIELKTEVDERETTAFNPSSTSEVWSEVLGGIASASCSAEGQWEAADATKVDDASWSALGGVGPLTVCPAGGAVAAGDLAYLTKMLTGSYQLGGSVGDVAPWTLELAGSYPLVRGSALHPPGTARTATGTGTAVQIGALSATQALYVTLHVLSVSGSSSPTITVKIQSDDNSGFSSATDRTTFTAATAVGGQTAKISGAVTDDYWRAQWTVTGTSPSFLLMVAAGIGPS